MKKKWQKSILFTLFFPAFIFIGGCRQPEDLKILESYFLDIPEISGMSWRTDPQNKSHRQLVLVGDKKNAFYLFDWDHRHLHQNLRKININQLINKQAEINLQGQWEAVFADESGRVFLLQEHPARILVINSALTEIENEISLELSPSIKADINWDANPNSQGEGFILLNNGHLLISKEKQPIRLLEFSPLEKKAQGFKPIFSLQNFDSFQIPFNSKLYATAMWKLPSDIENKVVDVSEIHLTANGRLFFLSDQGRAIIEINHQISIDQKELNIEKVFLLPKELNKAEGMVMDNDHRPIVAIDAKISKKNGSQKNIFLLEPIL
jgi:hypothetical protein